MREDAIFNYDNDAENLSAGISMAQFESESKTKRRSRVSLAASRNDNKSKYTGTQVGEYENIRSGVSSSCGDSTSGMSVRDTIELMQKAYNNVPVVGGAIDTMVALTNSPIKFVGKNKTAVKFFTNWEKQIKNWSFRSQFFREYFMSSNVFIYSFDGEITYSDFRKMSRAAITQNIPIRYTILNPYDVRSNGGASLINATYSKILNPYEVSRLKNPVTPEEIKFKNSLPPEVQRELSKGVNNITLTLDQQRLTAIFDGKQDYQEMAIPRFFSVLKDCNFKEELRKSEMVLARSADKFILLITCGAKEYDSKLNAQLRQSIVELFSQESLGRVFVSDYTTKMDFIIPDMGKIFGVDKYKAVNEDIANALMNIFWKDESFSNSMIKTQIFLERLQTAREVYEREFLIPQMTNIAETLGLSEIPEIRWEDFALKDDLEYKKLYVRLCELGIFTAEETFEAFKTHQLPTNEDSLDSQKEYKKNRDAELYQPLLGKPAGEAGRPPGSKAPKKKIKVSPVGASDEGETRYSLQKISENVKLISSINTLIEEAYKTKMSISRLSKKHKEITWMITESLVTNEPKEKWEEKIPEYLISVKDVGEVTDDVLSLAAQHSVSPIVASLLINSTYEEN